MSKDWSEAEKAARHALACHTEGETYTVEIEARHLRAILEALYDQPAQKSEARFSLEGAIMNLNNAKSQEEIDERWKTVRLRIDQLETVATEELRDMLEGAECPYAADDIHVHGRTHRSGECDWCKKKMRLVEETNDE